MPNPNDKHRPIHLHFILHLLATKCVRVYIYMVMAMLDEHGEKADFFWTLNLKKSFFDYRICKIPIPLFSPCVLSSNFLTKYLLIKAKFGTYV